MRGISRLAAAAVVTVALATAGPARADLAGGRDRLVSGDYRTAIGELNKVGGKDRAPSGPPTA